MKFRWRDLSACMLGALVAGALIIIARPAAASRQAPWTAAETGAAAPPAQIAVPANVSDPSGIHLAVQLNAVKDFSTIHNASNPPGGRWIGLDVTVTNAGINDFLLSPSNFQIQSGEALIYYAAEPSADLPAPQLDAMIVSPGQTVRVTTLFDIPTGQSLQSALFRAQGTTQFVIAPLTR